MRTWVGLISAALLVVSSSASATIVWNFDYTNGTTLDVAGTLTTTDTISNGGYVVTGITGFRNGTDAIVGLANPPTLGTYGFDNLLLTGPGSLLDAGGIAFFTNSGGAFNVCGATPAYSGYFCGSTGYTEYGITNGIATSVSFTATRVPEPATLSLLGLGLIAVGFMRRRTAG